ncbi:MAG TPA: methyltransferase [Usitatibacter sp.]|nr:methyltransferase [Usitatibacter sp.]
MSTPTFPKLDPADPGFWDARYEARFAPWDAGRVPADLRRFVLERAAPLRTLVPGCGSAWDVRFLAERGWDVLGIDFSAQAVQAARDILGPHAERVRRADVFSPIAEAPFDLVYERAFLCALPRRLWRDWGRRVAQLVPAGGLLAGYFYFDAGDRGPPFPLHGEGELAELLEPSFIRTDDRPVSDSIPVFAGHERWQVWRRQ